ncbi:hypothetical protein [Cognatiyoonia sp. IB215182]|uniref:hypothetical protein n=1 Tax=Cognatiyoonia sp. IB215182 TaxID=3097353 RepID=UPI002A14D3B1|nr:hypothetical protein [Cognatiyoonia sp. IB215182]MDX8355118.1 hypothetical protein [Cognatiyoonia sp. IB215182]
MTQFQTQPIIRLGAVSAAMTTLLLLAYLLTLALGLMSLPNPDQPIGDPYFTLMELLIIVMVPIIILMMVAILTICPASRKPQAIAALVFMAMMGTITMSVHFAILILQPNPAFADMSRVLTFTWPSVVYVLDILAWDIFFALGVILAAGTFDTGPLAFWIRLLLWTSGLLALAGLAGVPTGDMQLRNIGIVGYAVVFPIATALIGVYFHRLPHMRGSGLFPDVAS